MAKTKRTTREKRVLTGAVLIAAVMVGGSTFAWFTSSDEVTNRLTASADYGVAITEEFTPPEDWLPGQEITKKAGAVNTGNIDAYVRLDLTHALQGTMQGEGVEYTSDVNTEKLASALDDKERILLQAGGYLAYTDAEGVTDEKINSNTYKPTKKGLYIFRRQITGEFAYSGYYCDGGDTPKYYGLVNTKLSNGDYTVDAVLTPTPAPTDTGNKDDGKLTSVSGVKLANTAKLETGTPTSVLAKKGADKKWVTNSVTWADATHILVTYPGKDSGTADDIVIALKLGEKSKWTYQKDAENDGKSVDGYFYYNQLLKSGEATSDLIVSATLDDSVQSGAYLTMTYDLTVGLDSVQCVKNESGTYQNTSIVSWNENATVDSDTGNPTWNS